jgi:uncharacterized membrane protein
VLSLQSVCVRLCVVATGIGAVVAVGVVTGIGAVVAVA